LVGNFGRKEQLVKPRRRWENNIEMDFKRILYEVVHWIHLDGDRDQGRVFVNAKTNFQFS
jgi:hypothetical protein